MEEDKILDLAMRMYGRAIRADADPLVYQEMWQRGRGKNATEQSLMIDCARVAVRILGAGSMAANSGQSAIEDLRMLRNVYKEFILTRAQADEILEACARLGIVSTRKPMPWPPREPKPQVLGRVPIALDEDV